MTSQRSPITKPGGLAYRRMESGVYRAWCQICEGKKDKPGRFTLVADRRHVDTWFAAHEDTEGHRVACSLGLAPNASKAPPRGTEDRRGFHLEAHRKAIARKALREAQDSTK